MANQQWKADERVVAKRLHGKRIALSGGPGASSKADVLVPGWFIEVKRRARFPGARWLEECTLRAHRENRCPVVVVHVAHSQSWVVVLNLSDFGDLLGVDMPDEVLQEE